MPSCGETSEGLDGVERVRRVCLNKRPNPRCDRSMQYVDCCSFTGIYPVCRNGQNSQCNPPQVRVRSYRTIVWMTRNTTGFLYINFIYHGEALSGYKYAHLTQAQNPLSWCFRGFGTRQVWLLKGIGNRIDQSCQRLQNRAMICLAERSILRRVGNLGVVVVKRNNRSEATVQSNVSRVGGSHRIRFSQFREHAAAITSRRRALTDKSSVS